MWQVEYTREASNYALDSYPYNEGVLMAIEELGLSADGFPADGCRAVEPEIWLWEVAEHTVIYYRNEEERKIRIAMIKPLG